MKINRGANPGFLVLWLLVAAFALFGCGKQETTPESTPATPPPVAATGNKHCNPNGKACEITSAQIYDEDHGPDKSKHGCAPWDDNEAIHVSVSGASGKFKKIVVKPGTGHDTFDMTVQACPGSSGNPFPYAQNNGHHNGWDSGDVDPKAKPYSHYQLIMKEKVTKGSGKSKKVQSDPHIVIDN